MINNKRVIALIPARGGSKGIKGKNIIDLCGKPLISYTIDAAKNSQYIDDIIVSTDNEEIKEVAQSHGALVPFMRPEELASDHSKTIDAVVYTLDRLNKEGRSYDILILLQPTVPLRDQKDIDDAIEKFIIAECNSLVSVCEVDENPILTRTIENEKLKNLLEINSTVRRQDMPQFYKINGAIYINWTKDVNCNTSFNDNESPFIMEKRNSVDIDDYLDLVIAEYYLKRNI